MNNIDKIKKALETVNMDIKVTVMENSESPEDIDNFEGYNIDGVYLYTGMREVYNSISGVDKVPFWIVGYDTIVSGGHWEPDDYDFVEYAEYRSFSDAVTEAINLHIKRKLDNMFEYLGNEEYYNWE